MTRLVFEKLAQPLTANQLWPIGIAGDFFRVEACEWPVTVALYVGGREVGRMAQVRAGDYVRDMPFDEIRVINGTVAQTVTVQIAGGGVGTDRVLGEVSVIDGGKARTIAGQAFAWAGGAPNVAGQNGVCQLQNPAGSGKRIIVKAYSIALGAAGSAYLGEQVYSDQPLAGAGAASSSKLVGNGGTSSAVIRSGTVAALVGGQKYLDFSVFSAAGTVQKTVQEPIVIREGYGIEFVSSTPATTLNWTAEWLEEAL